jgi:Tetratricopeptide repeat
VTEHPHTLGSVNNLAGCLHALGDAEAALPLYRRAADGFHSLFGPDHPSSGTVRANRDLLERKVAREITRPTLIAKGKVGPRAKPWWRRLFG